MKNLRLKVKMDDYADTYQDRKNQLLDAARKSLNTGKTIETVFKTKCGASVKRVSFGIGDRWKHDNTEYLKHVDRAIETKCGCLWTGKEDV
jgi:hypothetical protein